MKLIQLVFLLLTTSSLITTGQECNCKNNPDLNERISCDTIFFDNSAKLFWNFNCDSSWLTFQTPSKNQSIIFSMGMVDLTGQLGYTYATEFANTFLIQNDVISGCCTPPDFYLLDKESGVIKNNLGRLIFYSENKKYPIIVSFSNDNGNSESADYNTITVYNVDKSEKYFVSLTKGEIEQAMKNMQEINAENLFDEPVLKDNKLILKYFLDNTKDKAGNHLGIVTIDLERY